MNGYGLVAVIVQSIASLAWPAALVAAVWLFRSRLAELLPLLRVKHKDWEASFRLDQAEKEASELLAAPVDEASGPTPEEKSRFEQVAELSPRAAILEKRSELDEAVRSLADRHAKSDRPQTLLFRTRALRNKGVIDHQTSALLDDLRVVGNAAAHSGTDTQFTKEEAMRFGALADRTIDQLRAAELLQ